MATNIVRRLYFYSAAFIGLQIFAAGLRRILALLLERLFWPAAIGGGEVSAERLSFSVALLAVGLPLWAFHWLVAQRGLDRPEEQLSTLRRLYGYAVLLVAALGVLYATYILAGALLRARTYTPEDIAAALAALLVDGAIWVYHWRVMAADRVIVERRGGQATLRRWYMLICQAVGLSLGGYAAAGLVGTLLRIALQPGIGDVRGVRAAVASLIAGFVFWLPHHLWARRLLEAPTPLRADEARSTLRQVYAALVITITAVAALGAAALLLQTALLAAFGGASWSEIVTDHTQAIGSLLVAVPLWLYHRGQLAQEARLSEVVARGDTARRVIGYLTSAVGLGALYFGVAGLAGALLSIVLAPDAIGDAWREPLSWYLAATIVSLPVYVLASRSMERLAHSDPVEQRTLARRIYLYIALLFGIVSTVSAAVLLIRQLLEFSLGAAEPGAAAQAGRYFAYAAIGAVVAWYHIMLLRRTAAPAAGAGAGRTIAILAPDSLGEALAASIKRELPAAEVQRLEDAAPAAALAGADTLVLTLDAALDPQLAPALQSFDGRKLLLPVGAGYEVAGVRERDDALIRSAVQLLRAAPPARPADEVTAGAAPATG